MVLDARAQARCIALQAIGADRPEFDIGLIVDGGNLDIRLKLLPTCSALNGRMKRDWYQSGVHGGYSFPYPLVAAASTTTRSPSTQGK
jgi:hypothetical protein